MIDYHIVDINSKNMSILTEQIENYIEPIVNDLGFLTVRVAFIGASKTKTLQLMIERRDENAVTIENCETVSRAVSVALDSMDPIKGQYNLEVSSTGIDRPLVKPSDYKRFVGKHIVLKTHVLKNERKTFKGILDSATEHGIKLYSNVLEKNADIIEFEYNEIKYAHIDGSKYL